MEERPLDDDEAALVFRRASELDVELASATGGWDVDRLEAVGREVGISGDAVRRAVAEVRLGERAGELRGPVVRTIRIVPVPPEAAQRELTAWLRDQLLEPVRDRPGVVVAERRDDAEAQRRRRIDSGRRYRLRTADRVALAVAAVPGGGSAVRIDVRLAGTRVRRGIAEAACLGSVGGVASVLALPIQWLALPVAGGAAVAGWWRSGRHHDRRAAEIALAVDGAIDRLEK